MFALKTDYHVMGFGGAGCAETRVSLLCLWLVHRRYVGRWTSSAWRVLSLRQYVMLHLLGDQLSQAFPIYLQMCIYSYFLIYLLLCVFDPLFIPLSFPCFFISVCTSLHPDFLFRTLFPPFSFPSIYFLHDVSELDVNTKKTGCNKWKTLFTLIRKGFSKF
jgi:hypothetical protein